MSSEQKLIRKLDNKGPWVVEVPGSKSITNRALMLAAMSAKKCVLEGVLFSDDSRAFLDCLQVLGFNLEIDEANKKVCIEGTCGKIPNGNVAINVGSAGTAARFLTVMLALAGGDYEMNSSQQMEKRPMEPLLSILSSAGVVFEFMKEDGHFPFKMHSHGINMEEVEVDTTISSQFTSALLMAGVLLEGGLKIRVTGSRPAGSYILMTLSMMEQFGIRVEKGDGSYRVYGDLTYGLDEYEIEPDLSGAAYFYALAPMFGANVKVKRVHKKSLQGDIKFVELLERLGCVLDDESDGLWVKGEGLKEYEGITVDMKDFSDQVMTMASVSVFAKSETKILNVGHIRFQESDRMTAVITELNKMGIACEKIDGEEGIRIQPGTPHKSVVETYNDHRMAMAMSLIGLKTGEIVIDNPMCCRKTFENYFDKLEELYEN